MGFFPRHYWVRWDEGAGVCRHGYKVLGFSPKELYGREFSIILTKGCFMHRDWLAVYTERLPQGIKDHVEQNRNCEDIAMQFLVAGVTGEAPRQGLGVVCAPCFAPRDRFDNLFNTRTQRRGVAKELVRLRCYHR